MLCKTVRTEHFSPDRADELSILLVARTAK
jgi:hypothetical protein